MNGLILCTRECNLRCKYCFEEAMHNKLITTLDNIRDSFEYFIDFYLDKFVTELVQTNERLERETSVTLHGGEPLLIGDVLLEKALKKLVKYPDVDICIQTNGTLITDKTISLFKEYGVKVGISIDGSRDIHNKYRVNKGGQGTFDLVYNNIKKMKNAGILVGAMATITNAAIENIQSFYSFFKDNNLDFSFNPCFQEMESASYVVGLNMKEFTDFYKKLFDLWIQDNSSNISITCYERIISSMCIKNKPFMEVCTFIPDCSMTTVAIDTAGDFYRCLHYCMDQKNRIGNIMTDDLSITVGDVAFSERWDIMKNTICKDCDIHEYCYGGCPYVSESLYGTIHSKPNTCLSQREIVHYIYDYLQQYVRA